MQRQREVGLTNELFIKIIKKKRNFIMMNMNIIKFAFDFPWTDEQKLFRKVSKF